MANERIDFEGNLCSLHSFQPIRILRTNKPPMLEACMNTTQWIGFCDEIDNIIEPLNRCRKRAAMVMGISVLIFLVNILRFNPQNLYACIIVQCLATFSFIYSKCFISSKANSVLEDIETACKDMSKNHSVVDFIVHFDVHAIFTEIDATNYIAIKAAKTDNQTPESESTISISDPEIGHFSYSVEVMHDRKKIIRSTEGRANLTKLSKNMSTPNESTASLMTNPEELYELEIMKPP